jgi:hypothetical protein
MGYDPDLVKGSSEWVYEVLKCLYGLRPASRAWRKDVHAFLSAQGFISLHADPCLYILKDEEGKITALIGVHVDDFLLSAHAPMMTKIKSLLNGKYEMKDLGALSN